MGDNRKMRKFEGTCYIPGEQLAMMAKYYRGANLNLNLTLMEEEGIMKESLESSCWCSKLDDVDRMKLRHMKGDIWATDHEHHQGVPGGHPANAIDRGPMSCCFGVAKSPRDMKEDLEARADKGTDTMSLYHHPPRRDYYDPRFDVRRGSQPMQDRYDVDRNYRRRDSQRRGYFPNNNYDNRTNYNIQAYYATNSQCKDYDTYQYRGSVDPDMEDDIASRYTEEDSDNDIKCAVCRKDVCAVCKNPIRGWPCRCKCVIPNAGLCNECDIQCEKESVKDDDVRKSQQQQQKPQTENNLSNLMLLLMSSQMFNRSQNTESSCKCVKNIPPNLVGDSESSSGSSSCSCCSEKVQKIFLYDCGASENTKNKKTKKSKELSGGESSGCDCCKCSKKSKKHEGKGNNKGKSSNSTARRESNESKQSGRSQSSSSPSKSTKLLGRKTNNFKPNATSSKNSPSSPAKQEEIGSRLRKSTSSIKDQEESGKKGSSRRSRFKKPLVDGDNQSISSKNDEPKTNKRKRTEGPIVDDNESQSSHKSAEEEGSIKKSKSSSDITNFLVWLPKIKSDLEQLLMKMKDEGRIATNVKSRLQPTFLAPKPNTTNFTRRNVPFITHPASDATRPTDLLNWSTGSLFNFRKRHRSANNNYGCSKIQNHSTSSAQWNGCNKFNLEFSPQNHKNKDGRFLEQQYPPIFYSLPQGETTTTIPQKNIIGDRWDGHLKSNIKQDFTCTSNTLWPTNKQPHCSGIRTSCQGPSNSLLQCQQMGDEYTYENRSNVDKAWQLHALRPEISDASHVFHPSDNVWDCQQIGVEHTKYGNTGTLNPPGQKTPLLAYHNQNSVDQELVKIQTVIPGRAYKHQFSEFSATRQTVQPSEHFRHYQPISVNHDKYGNTNNLDTLRQQTPLFAYNEQYSVDQETVKIQTSVPERTCKHPFSNVQKSKTVWSCQPLGVEHTKYGNMTSSSKQNAILAFNNQDSVDRGSLEIQTLFPERNCELTYHNSAPCNMVQPSNNSRHCQQIGFKYESPPSIHQIAVQAYDNQNAWNQIDQVKIQTFPNSNITYTQRTLPVMENCQNPSLTNASKQERTTDGPEGNREEMNAEGIQVDQNGQGNISTIKIEGSLKNVMSLSEDFVTVKEKQSNDPMQSSGSKPTSDQFISAIEVNEQLSEDNVLSQRDHKETIVDTNGLGCGEFPKQITNQSIGPGQFKVTVSSNAPGFNLSDCPQECMRHYNTQTGCRKKRQDEDPVTKVSSKLERQNDQSTVKSSSKVSTEENDHIAPEAHRLGTVISSEKTKLTTKEDRFESERSIMAQQNESAVSERLLQITDSQVLSSDLELRALSPAMTVDARFYNLIDQIKSMSAATNDSKFSFLCGVAQSSSPSSEENTDLSQLPREHTEVSNAADDKKYCGRTGSAVRNALKVADVSDSRVLNCKAQPQNEIEQHWVRKSPAFGVNILADGNRHMTTLQLAKFKLAQEAIQSMVNNVNDVLASIDSESDSNIDVTPSDCENKEIQSFFVHLEGDRSEDEHPLDTAISRTHETIVQKVCYNESTPVASTSRKCNIIHNSTNRRIFKSQLASMVADTPASLSSFSSNESRIRSPRTPTSLNQTISRERKFFVLDSSRSNSSVFTEKLRRSLAQETSSPNLSAVITPEEFTNRSSCEVTRTGSSKKPLKRRSWIQ